MVKILGKKLDESEKYHNVTEISRDKIHQLECELMTYQNHEFVQHTITRKEDGHFDIVNKEDEKENAKTTKVGNSLNGFNYLKLALLSVVKKAQERSSREVEEDRL